MLVGYFLGRSLLNYVQMGSLWAYKLIVQNVTIKNT